MTSNEAVQKGAAFELYPTDWFREKGTGLGKRDWFRKKRDWLGQGPKYRKKKITRERNGFD